MDEKQSTKFCSHVRTRLLGFALLLIALCLCLVVYMSPGARRATPQLQRIPIKNIKSQRGKNPDPVSWRTLRSATFFEFKEVPHNWRSRSSQFPSGEGYIFKSLYDKGVFTFHDLCIVNTPPHWSDIDFDVTERENNHSHVRHVHIHSKHLVVYNALMDVNIKIRVRTGPNVVNNFWWLTLVKKPIPTGSHVITNHTAFFVIPTCEGNLHHFWQDYFLGLYGSMKATKRLNSSVPNQLFYDKPLWDFDKSDGCHDPSRYEEMLFALSIRHQHFTYHKMADGTCYRDAVFGAYGKGFWQGEPEGHVSKMLDADVPLCKHRTVLIQQRRNRKILNAEELQKAAQEMGFLWTHIVTFENLTLREQVQYVVCSNVLVGVQGAGLQWLRFMKPGAGVLEIAWPQKHWGFYYEGYAETCRLNYERMQAKEVFLNFTSYSIMVKKGKPISEDEKVTLESKPPANERDNHWKWADVYIDTELFKTKLKALTARTGVRFHR